MDIVIEPIKNTPDITRVRISGRIDSYTVGQVDEELSSLINIGSNKLVCDLGGVEFVAGPGLKCFLRLIQSARKQNGDMKLFQLQPEVKKLFSLAGFSSIAKLYLNENAALQAFGVVVDEPDFEKTMIAGMNDAYAQTLIPGAMNIKDVGFEKTLLPGADIGFEKTMIPGADIGFEKTMIPGADIGFEQTMMEKPRGGLPDDLRSKLAQVTQQSAPAEEGGDVCEALRKKLAAAAASISETPKHLDDNTCQTIMSQIDALEVGEDKSSPVVLPESASTQKGALSEPVVEPVRLALPKNKKYLTILSQLTGALGALCDAKSMDMVKFGVAVVEVARAGMAALPEGGALDVRIECLSGCVQVTVAVPVESFSLYEGLRPPLETDVTTADAAEAWLRRLVDAVGIDMSAGQTVISLSRT